MENPSWENVDMVETSISARGIKNPIVFGRDQFLIQK
jgi:hypothetical protein